MSWEAECYDDDDDDDDDDVTLRQKHMAMGNVGMMTIQEMMSSK